MLLLKGHKQMLYDRAAKGKWTGDWLQKKRKIATPILIYSSIMNKEIELTQALR